MDYNFRLSPEVENKAEEMKIAYTYLYKFENFLRNFIEMVAKQKLGENYWKELKINSEIRQGVGDKKKQEEDHKWLVFRKDSNLYYTNL